MTEKLDPERQGSEIPTAGATVVLPPEFKRRWIADLRSDKYVQIDEKLGDCSNGRCCLGVAADVAMDMGLVPNLTVSLDEEQDTRFYRFDDGHESSTLPTPVSEALKIGGDDVLLKVEKDSLPDHVKLSPYDEMCDRPGMYYASALNDAGMTFAEIADLIEDQL